METDLRVLDLNYNLIDFYPSALRALQGLRHLLLRHNRLKEVDELAFEKCNHLEFLDLSHNALQTIPVKALSVSQFSASLRLVLIYF